MLKHGHLFSVMRLSATKKLVTSSVIYSVGFVVVAFLCSATAITVTADSAIATYTVDTDKKNLKKNSNVITRDGSLC